MRAMDCEYKHFPKLSEPFSLLQTTYREYSVLGLLNRSFPCLASAGEEKPATSYQSLWLRACCNYCVGCVHCAVLGAKNALNSIRFHFLPLAQCHGITVKVLLQLYLFILCGKKSVQHCLSPPPFSSSRTSLAIASPSPPSNSLGKCLPVVRPHWHSQESKQSSAELFQ